MKTVEVKCSYCGKKKIVPERFIGYTRDFFCNRACKHRFQLGKPTDYGKKQKVNIITKNINEFREHVLPIYTNILNLGRCYEIIG